MDDEDQQLKEHYANDVGAKRCPCDRNPPVGFYRCQHKRTGRVVYLYSCQACLNGEASGWDPVRVPAPGGEPEAVGQLELMI